MNLQRLTKEYRKVQMKGKEKLTLMEKLMVNGDNKDPYKLLSPGSSLSGIKSFTQMTSNMMHNRCRDNNLSISCQSSVLYIQAYVICLIKLDRETFFIFTRID
ncbi:hypothetical protein Bca4012_094863 [Brassica carinata]